MQGFGWAIAKQLAEAGAEISLGVWVSVCREVWSMVDVLKQDGTLQTVLHIMCYALRYLHCPSLRAA